MAPILFAILSAPAFCQHLSGALLNDKTTLFEFQDNYSNCLVILIFFLIFTVWNDSVLSNLIWAVMWQKQQSDCAPSHASDQPRHPPSLIRVFAVCKKKAWVLSFPLSAQRRLWSDWADAQADLSLCWAHSHFVGCVMSQLISIFTQGS